MSGFIYIISNPSFSDGLLKIGKSQKDPTLRKDELYSTGVPEPFEVEYYAFVEDHDATELLIHKILKNFRPQNRREFFNCSVPHAILTIQQNADIKHEEIFYQSAEEIEEEKRRQVREKIKQNRLEEENKRQELKEREEEDKRRLRQQEIDRKQWEKKKGEFKDVAIYLVKIAALGGSWLALLYLFELFETKDNWLIFLFLIVCYTIFVVYVFRRISKKEETKPKTSKLDKHVRGRRESEILGKVTLKCPACHARLRILKGKQGTVKCPKCGELSRSRKEQSKSMDLYELYLEQIKNNKS